MKEIMKKFLLWRFNINNHPKYRKFASEWVENTTPTQITYFEREMEHLIKKGIYQP